MFDWFLNTPLDTFSKLTRTKSLLSLWLLSLFITKQISRPAFIFGDEYGTVYWDRILSTGIVFSWAVYFLNQACLFILKTQNTELFIFLGVRFWQLLCKNTSQYVWS